MAGGGFSRDKLLRARTVTLADGTAVRFSALDFEQYENWVLLQNEDHVDRDYVRMLLAALSSDQQSNLVSFMEWQELKVLELAEEYLSKVGRQDAVDGISNFNQARQQLDAYIRGEQDKLTEAVQQGLKGFESVYASLSRIPVLDGGVRLAKHLQHYDNIIRSDLNAIAEMQHAQMKSLESLMFNITPSLLQHSELVERMSHSLGPFLDWANAFRSNFDGLYSVFQRSVAVQIPHLREAFIEERRADFLLEINFHFLLDTTDSLLNDFAEQLCENAADANDSQITKYLHKATSNEEFTSGLLEMIASVPEIGGRRRAIGAALEAHAGRNYLLSIPALLPQVEALTMHLLKREGHVRWDRKRRKWFEVDPVTGHSVPSRNGDRRFVNGLGQLSGVESRLAPNPIPEGLPLIKDEVARYRNDVLHGRLIRYDRPRESSRLVLLVLLLTSVLSSEEEADLES